MEDTKLRLYGLNRLDKRELQQELDPSLLSFEEPVAEGGEHGELVTVTAIVLVGIVSLRLLAAWLLKTRRSEKLNETVEIELPNGTRIKKTLSVDLKGSDEPEAEVLNALTDLFPAELAGLDLTP